VFQISTDAIAATACETSNLRIDIRCDFDGGIQKVPSRPGFNGRFVKRPCAESEFDSTFVGYVEGGGASDAAREQDAARQCNLSRTRHQLRERARTHHLSRAEQHGHDERKSHTNQKPPGLRSVIITHASTKP
jgi:hypothetical protein